MPKYGPRKMQRDAQNITRLITQAKEGQIQKQWKDKDLEGL